MPSPPFRTSFFCVFLYIDCKAVGYDLRYTSQCKGLPTAPNVSPRGCYQYTLNNPVTILKMRNSRLRRVIGIPTRLVPAKENTKRALPWVEQGWARRQSHLGPGAGRCAPPDPMRKVLHHLQKETLGCPSSPCCPARGPGAQGQQGQASPSFRAGAEPPRAGPYFQGPGQHSAPHGLQGEHRMQG